MIHLCTYTNNPNKMKQKNEYEDNWKDTLAIAFLYFVAGVVQQP